LFWLLFPPSADWFIGYFLIFMPPDSDSIEDLKKIAFIRARPPDVRTRRRFSCSSRGKTDLRKRLGTSPPETKEEPKLKHCVSWTIQCLFFTKILLGFGGFSFLICLGVGAYLFFQWARNLISAKQSRHHCQRPGFRLPGGHAHFSFNVQVTNKK
jgi:hypothetical protein